MKFCGRRLRSIVGLTLITILSQAAQSETQGLDASSALNLELPSEIKASPGNYNQLEVQNSQYINSGKPAFRSGASPQATSVRLQVDDGVSWRGFDAKLIGSSEYNATERWNYGDVHEAYLSYRVGNNTLSLGRKLDVWSAWDARWGQGEFQPRYMENRMRESQAGLVGAFYNVHLEHWSYTLGVLPVYVPDFGAHFSVQNNELVSKNPWFKAPSPNFQWNGSPGDIHYAVIAPDATNVISHPGLATKLEFQSGVYSSRLSFAYKPMPAFTLGFPSNGQFFTADTNDFLQVNITPRVVYNRVVNLDNQVNLGHWVLAGSVAVDNPVSNPAPANYTAQQIAPAQIFSATVSHPLEEPGPHAAQIELSYLRVLGGDLPNTGDFASASTTLFERRFEYTDAVMLGVKKDFRALLPSPLENEVRLIYDRLQQGASLSFTTATQLSKDWRADLQMDLIGLLSSQGQIRDGYFASFRANSRVGMGIGYVF